MSDIEEVVPTVEGSPESFGWLRRPEFETPTKYVYEHPDGSLMAFARGEGQRRPWLIKYDWMKIDE